MKFIITSTLLVFIYSFGFSQTAEVHFEKAESLYKTEKFKQALKEIDLALDEDVKNGDFILLKCKILGSHGKYDASLELLNRGIALNPNHIELLQSRAVLMSFYDPEGSIREIYKIFTLIEDPKVSVHDTVLVNLLLLRSSSYLNIRNYEKASADVESALLIDSTGFDIIFQGSLIAFESGDQESGYKMLEGLADDNPNDVGIHNNLGYYAGVLNKHEEAVKYLSRAIELEPNEAYPYSNLGYSQLQIGDTKNALKNINKSMKMDPSNSYVYRNRALLYISTNNEEKACVDINEGLLRGFTEQYGPELDALRTKHCK